MKRYTIIILLTLAVSSLFSCSDVSDAPVSDMALIPAGEFIRGSSESSSEMPESKVYLEKYYIDIYEVSNAQYKYFLDKTNHKAPDSWSEGNYEAGKDDYPVVNVSYYDAYDYCRWIGKRLPKEEEWEKAARGPDGNIYPWGDEDATDEKANYGHNVGETTPVSDYPLGASYYGVYNMSGNVWEWTASWYKLYVGNEEDSNPEYDEAYKVLRGGGWNSSSASLRGSARGRRSPDEPLNTVGFRCAK